MLHQFTVVVGRDDRIDFADEFGSRYLRYEELGANARIAEQLKPGDPLVLMGPTGAPAELGEKRTVMVIAGAWGAAVMIDLGRALRAAGNRVLFFASFRCDDDIYFKDELEQSADQIIWARTTDSRFLWRRKRFRTLNIKFRIIISHVSAYYTSDE